MFSTKVFLQELLQKAVEVELEKERKELELQRKLPAMLTQSAAEPIKVRCDEI